MKYLFIAFFLCCIISCTWNTNHHKARSSANATNGIAKEKIDSTETILFYTANPAKDDIQMFWKDDSAKILNHFKNLKNYVEQKNKKLVFAMNGGMFQQDFSPLGLYIENKKLIHKLNKAVGEGNFYLKPNGIFFIKNKQAQILSTEKFRIDDNISFATQSGPMLLIDGKIHEAFNKNSKNLNIRNGVGILPNGDVVFAMSKQEMNFYDFAYFFKTKGCEQALYLDGFVSRVYFPYKNWIQYDGRFGVMIAVLK